MMLKRRYMALLGVGMLVMPTLTSCQSVDDERIPAVPVAIRLGDAGRWNTYGVSGFGLCRYFIRQTGEPANFPYTEQTYTGFGGVLLIGGTPGLRPRLPRGVQTGCQGKGKSRQFRGHMPRLRLPL